MDGPDLWKILIAAVGFGAGGEAMRRYRRFKNDRRAMAAAYRNAGFWTDRRLYRAEATFAALALAVPWTALVLLIGADRPIWVTYILLVLYPAAIYLLMRNMNANERQ